MKYGITTKDLEVIQKKHEIQRAYLKDKFFIGSTGQYKSLLDVSFSANHSKRYYSEIINKINTMNEIVASELIEYSNIFITATLDGFFRDFLKGDFSRYNEDKHKKLIPNNDRFGHLKDKIASKEKFTIKDLYNILNYQMYRFQSSQKYRKIKKAGYKAHYIRVAEPHKKDGVPHIHMMLYVPVEFKNDLLKAYREYFPAPQNIKKLKNCKLGQLNGFQWDIKSAPAYILKYLFKSFLNVENESELDELQTWYIKHRILRVVTSHSLVPAWVYRKTAIIEKDWHYLTDIIKTGIASWNQENDYFMFQDEQDRVLRYHNGTYEVFNKNRLIKSFGKKKDTVSKDKPFRVDLKLKYKKKIKNLHVIVDGVDYVTVDNKLKKFNPIPIPSRMTDKILTEYFNEQDNKPIDQLNIPHYKVTKNEMIKRGLFNNKKLELINGNFELINSMPYETFETIESIGF